MQLGFRTFHRSVDRMKHVFVAKVLGVILLSSEIVCLSPITVLFDSTNHWHRDLRYHPEQPERISACVRALQQVKQNEHIPIDLFDVATTTDAPISYSESGITHAPFSAQELEHARNMLLQVHEPNMVTVLEERCNESKQKRIDDGKPALGHLGNLDPDTYVTTETFGVCLRAAAAWIRAADGGAALALTRPPGHHATRTQPNGFCLYNFAAATAAHVLLAKEDAKVSILDWDVHYGQGVADIVKGMERARYISIHQTPAFPYLGESLKLDGEHQNVLTIPMPADTTWTCGYEELFDKALEFVACHGEWEPDVVIVCAGYDALGSDELASVSLNAMDYGRMTHKLIEHLNKSSVKQSKLLLGLEGGYQLNPSGACGNLPDAVVETVRAVAENI